MSVSLAQFRALMANGVDLSDRRVASALIDAGMRDEEARALLRRVDKNRDGVARGEELRALFEGVQRLEQGARRSDGKGDARARRVHDALKAARLKAPRPRAAPAARRPRTGNEVLFGLASEGASSKTAAQDLPKKAKVAPAGAAASNRMAETDRKHLERHLRNLTIAADEAGLPVALLAAIASRESRGGRYLVGDEGDAHGLLQVNKRFHADVTTHDPMGLAHMRQAASILRKSYDVMRKQRPTWSEAECLYAAVAAYNRGAGGVLRSATTRLEVDRGTTHGDYASDVWARARYLAVKWSPRESGVRSV